MLPLTAERKVLSNRALHMFQTPRTIVLLPRLAGIEPLLNNMCQKTLQCLELLLTRRVTGEGELLPSRDVYFLVPFQ